MERYHPSLGRRIETAITHGKNHTRPGIARNKAELIQHVPGCTPELLNLWITDQKRPTASQCRQIAATLGVTEEWIMTGDRFGNIIAPAGGQS